jgi:hypothetical protein
MREFPVLRRKRVSPIDPLRCERHKRRNTAERFLPRQNGVRASQNARSWSGLRSPSHGLSKGHQGHQGAENIRAKVGIRHCEPSLQGDGLFSRQLLPVRARMRALDVN